MRLGIVHGDAVGEIKLRTNIELGIKSLDVYHHVEITSVTEEIDELQYKSFTEEQNLSDSEEFDSEN